MTPDTRTPVREIDGDVVARRIAIYLPRVRDGALAIKALLDLVEIEGDGLPPDMAAQLNAAYDGLCFAYKWLDPEHVLAPDEMREATHV